MPEDTTTEAPEATDNTEHRETSEALTQAQAASGNAKDEPESQDDDDLKGNTPLARANREAVNLRAKLKKLEPLAARVKELEPLAAKAKELEDAKKSEVEKLNDQLAAVQVELQGHQVAAIRRDAASKAGLDPDLAEFITAADEETALEQAKRLAKRMAPPDPAKANFRQGTRTQPKPAQSRDDFIRGMAGYQT